MGIPQSDTVRSGSILGWALGGQQHLSTGVVKQQLPVVDAEDGQLWDAQKYERQELAKMTFSDGVLLGDVWRDGVNRDSFKVQYGAGNLTVFPGRCIMSGKRLDLGLGVSFDSGLVAAFVLPIGGHEKIIYLDIFERKITPPPAFAPAGIGMDISVYADFSVYNTADGTVKELDVLVGGALPVAGVGHHFMEISRVQSSGAVTDTRKMSYLKDPQKPNLRALFVSNATDAVIGQNCTHTDINLAIADLSSSLIGAIETSMKFLFVGGGAHVISTPGLTIPANINILSADPLNRKIDISGVESSGAIIPGSADYGWVTGLPSIDFQVAVSGAFSTASNLLIFSTTGNISNIAAIYSGCKIQSSGVASSFNGIFYDCEIAFYASTSTTNIFMERCRWVINEAFQIVSTNSQIFASRCAIQLVQSSPILNNFVFANLIALTCKFCNIEYYDGNSSSNNIIFKVATNGFSFEHCSFRCYGPNTSTTCSLFYVGGGSFPRCDFKHCNFETDGPDAFFRAAKDGGSWTVFDHCHFKSNCPNGFSPQAMVIVDIVTNGASGSRCYFQNSSFESDYAKCMSIIGANPQIGTLNIYMYNCMMINRLSIANNVFEMIISDSGNFEFTLLNCTFVSQQGQKTFKLSWTPPFATLTQRIFNCVFDSTPGVSSVDTNVNLNVANTTYTGAITGAGTFNALTAGVGANASNVRL